MMSPTKNRLRALVRRRKSARKSLRHPLVPKWVSEMKMLRYSARTPNPVAERKGAFIDAQHIAFGPHRVSEDSMTKRKIHINLQSHGSVIKSSLWCRLWMASMQSSVAFGVGIPVDFSKGRLWMVIVFN